MCKGFFLLSVQSLDSAKEQGRYFRKRTCVQILHSSPGPDPQVNKVHNLRDPIASATKRPAKPHSRKATQMQKRVCVDGPRHKSIEGKRTNEYRYLQQKYLERLCVLLPTLWQAACHVIDALVQFIISCEQSSWTRLPVSAQAVCRVIDALAHDVWMNSQSGRTRSPCFPASYVLLQCCDQREVAGFQKAA